MVAAGAFLSVAVHAAEPEMRAVWYTRFEWPAASEQSTKDNIRSAMALLRQHNFNAVLFQVRGECDTLYPSPYEPWGPQFSWTDPGWDPVQYAIEQAHANGLEFHAYINTHTITQSLPPAGSDHIYYLHGPNSPESWVIHDESGQPSPGTDGYVWMSPGVPAASAWTRQQILYMVENYDIDGLHFDRIRTPGPQYSHDPISEARFRGEGNPDGEGFGDFMRSQITRDLRRVYGAVMARKPHIKISAAPFGICRKEPGGYQGTGTESYYAWHQDSFGWMEKGVLDCLFPQIYWEIGSAHPYEVLTGDFLRHDGGRHIYPGMHSRNNEVAQIFKARELGAKGTTVFSMGSTDFESISYVAYAEPAPVPEMPWKVRPNSGIVIGTIREAAGASLVDARINRSNDLTNYLSAHDGFYAILNIPPGTHTIRANKGGYGEGTATVTVRAGDVKTVDLSLPRQLPPDAQGLIDVLTGKISGSVKKDKNGDKILDAADVQRLLGQ
jgi:uncharacterized lipoprotein YddW (UPF0748 family)